MKLAVLAVLDDIGIAVAIELRRQNEQDLIYFHLGVLLHSCFGSARGTFKRRVVVTAKSASSQQGQGQLATATHTQPTHMRCSKILRLVVAVLQMKGPSAQENQHHSASKPGGSVRM